MSGKVWDEITYPFPNYNSATVEVSEWISNFIPYIIMDVITDHVSKLIHHLIYDMDTSLLIYKTMVVNTHSYPNFYWR